MIHCSRGEFEGMLIQLRVDDRCGRAHDHLHVRRPYTEESDPLALIGMSTIPLYTYAYALQLLSPDFDLDFDSHLRLRLLPSLLTHITPPLRRLLKFAIIHFVITQRTYSRHRLCRIHHSRRRRGCEVSHYTEGSDPLALRGCRLWA